MKKILAILMTVMLLCVSSAALAVTVTIEDNDKAEVTITAADIDTGATITKSDYAKDMNIALRVKIVVPRFADTENCTVKWAAQGLRMAEDYNFPYQTGEYIVKGVITSMPAVFQIQIADDAFKNAQTAEQMLNALKVDRSQVITYSFGAAKPAKPAAGGVIIPKTGDISVLPYALSISLITFGLVCAGKRRR